MSRFEESWQPNQQSSERTPAPKVAKRARKRYQTPRLKEYGPLAELTRFGGSQVVDSGGGLGNPV